VIADEGLMASEIVASGGAKTNEAHALNRFERAIVITASPEMPLTVLPDRVLDPAARMPTSWRRIDIDRA
jgi:hypothetical protein